MVKFTVVPSLTGLPFTSFAAKVTVEVAGWPEPSKPITCGTADTNCMLPVAAGEMVTVVGALTLPAVALNVTEPALPTAEKVVVATPPTVEPDVFDRLPNVLSLMMKLTSVPSGTGWPLPLTVADSVVVPYTVMEAGLAIRLTLSGGGEEIVIVVVPVRLSVAYDASTLIGVAILFA